MLIETDNEADPQYTHSTASASVDGCTAIIKSTYAPRTIRHPPSLHLAITSLSSLSRSPWLTTTRTRTHTQSPHTPGGIRTCPAFTKRGTCRIPAPRRWSTRRNTRKTPNERSQVDPACETRPNLGQMLDLLLEVLAFCGCGEKMSADASGPGYV